MAICATDFSFIGTVVRDQAAIVLDKGKEYLVESRLTPLAAREGFSSLELMVEALRKNPGNGLTKKVVDAMTTNETSFFRDIEPFEVLKKHVLPKLIAARQNTRRLNVWCGASSTGQEPYSMAMLMLDNCPQLASWNVYFVATDISDHVLTKSREGRYTQLEVNRGLPVSCLMKYFEKKGVEWILKDNVRRMVRFEPLNLIQRWPVFPPLDIIMMRNVLIYFDVDVKKNILRKIHDCLSPDGYLFLGGAETTLNLDERFRRMPFERAGCYGLVQK